MLPPGVTVPVGVLWPLVGALHGLVRVAMCLRPYTKRVPEYLIQSPHDDPKLLRPCVQVAVVMRRECIDNPWQAWRWSLDDVVPHAVEFGAQPRLLFKSDQDERWLHPGFLVELHLGDAEGYYLNATTKLPCFWVVWRMEEEAQWAADTIAVPQIVTLSYHDAGRWLDAQETVEQLPAPTQIVTWLRAFVDQHHTPEPKRRQRPQSFQSLQDRFGNPVRVSTDKDKRGGGRGG